MPNQEKLKSQAEKFREAAKELETDNDEKRFDEKLRRIANAPEPPKNSPNEGD